MFTAARYLAIDDDLDELTPLIDSLHAIGIPCVGIPFDPLTLPDPALFTGVRVLFCDLQLVKVQASDQQHFDTIATLLDSCIPPSHGPYVLVLWTSHDEKRAALAHRLTEILSVDKHPVAVLGIDKNLYRPHGPFTEIVELKQAVRDRLAENPQLMALLSWERDVLAAANSTLAVLGGLIPEGRRALNDYPLALDEVLSSLAEAATGAAAARMNPRGAINAVLAPLLADRILSQSADAATKASWTRAVTFPGRADLTLRQRGQMNRFLHLAMPTAETVAPDDWGAALPLSGVHVADDAMRARFGLTASQIYEREFRIAPVNHASLVPILIRGGAGCDQAQAAAGPVPFLLGVLRPENVRKTGTPSPACRDCGEVFELEDGGTVYSLAVHARFTTTLLNGDLPAWPAAMFRIREQLLMTLLFHTSAHVMRPGTLRV